MSKFNLEIVTPERKFFEGEVDMVVVRGITGDMAILNNHVPLVTPLDISVVKMKIDGVEKRAAISSGYMEVARGKTTIVVDAAEWPDEIDLERAKRARERAEKRLKSEKDADVARAELALRRAVNRINSREL